MENHWWGLQTPRRLFTCDWCSVCNHLQFPPLDTQENYNINLESSNRSLKSIPLNLVDQVWKDRPPIQPDSLTRLPDRVISGFACVCFSAAHTHTQTHTAVYSSADVVPFIYVLINTCKQAAISCPTNTVIKSLFMFLRPAGRSNTNWENGKASGKGSGLVIHVSYSS